MSIIEKFKNLIFPLIYDGSPWLRDYEVKLLFSYFHVLNEVDRSKFFEQFKLLNNVQRGKGGKMVRFSQLSDQLRKNWGENILFKSDFGDSWSFDVKINAQNEPTRFSINFGNGAIVELKLKEIPITFQERFLKIFDVPNFFEKDYQFLAATLLDVELGSPKPIQDR